MAGRPRGPVRPMRTVLARHSGVRGAWPRMKAWEEVGRHFGRARPGPCGDRTCETDLHVRGIAIRMCISPTAYVVVQLTFVPRPPGALRRAGSGGRGRSDPPFSMPAVASAEVGMCTPSQPPRRVAPGQQSHAGRPWVSRDGRLSRSREDVCCGQPPSGHGFALARSSGPAAVGHGRLSY